MTPATRARLRRRFLFSSTPIALLLILVVVKLWSIVVAGGSVASDFAARDAGALRSDVATLNILNVVEPEKALFAAGNLAVLDDRLEDADAQFSAALARTEPGRSCPVLVNLEFVRETMGDRAAQGFDTGSALAWYRNALAVVDGAPGGCFAGSTDPDERRRSLLDGASARLNEKIDAAEQVAPPVPPPPLGSAPPPPSSSTSTTAPPARERRLYPEAGDPLERLQQILQDAAAVQNGG